MKIIYGSYLENLLSIPPKEHKEISKERKLELERSHRAAMNLDEMIEKWEKSPIKIYDDNGNLLREEKYQDDCLHRVYLAELTENIYDDNGNLIKTSFMETPYKQNGVE